MATKQSTKRRAASREENEQPAWTFLTNHARVLLAIARDPKIRLRDIAAEIGITERAAQRIVGELADEKYVKRIREGRRNRYELDASRPLRSPEASDTSVGDVLKLVTRKD